MIKRRLLHSLPPPPTTDAANVTSLSDYHRLLRSINSPTKLNQILSRLLILGLHQNPSTILFNSLLRSFTNSNNPRAAIRLYTQMLNRGPEPDNYSFTFVLKACVGAHDIKTGKSVHNQVIRRGLIDDLFIGTGLVDMYVKFGRVEIARKAFDSMPTRDVVSWNAMIAGFAKGGEPSIALGLLREMMGVGIEPNSVSFLNLFPAVCVLSEVMLCRTLHGFVVRRGFWASVSNGLVDTYSKCGDVESARGIFDGMLGLRDDVSWASMISGYVFNGFFLEALELFDEMRRDDLKLNQVSLMSALSAVAEIGDLERGMDIHNYAIQKGIDFDVPTITVLMTMYAKCRDLETAKFLFEGIQKKDIVAWSAMISSLIQIGRSKEALSLLREMVMRGFVPNKVTIVSALPACGDLLDVKSGKCIHCYALRLAIDEDVSVGTALISMYAQCELFTSAHVVFDALRYKEVITWNTLINGYAQLGDACNALRMFQQLRATGLQPDPGTMVGILPACALLNACDLGSSVHGLSIKNGFDSDHHVKNANIDMYAKCGNFPSAEILFCEAKARKDVISWNTMIAGYMHNGNANKALLVFREMRAENIKPNVVSLVSIIPAVAELTSLRDGLALHSFVITSGLETNVLIGNSLIDMYSKCGQIDCARYFFDWMDYKDTVSWNVMLSGYATNGLGEDSVALFKEMNKRGIKADSLSFVGVLSACRHGGLVEEGKKIFESIENELDLEPKMEHYACMVDLLGRTGQFD
ncbi:uncharacterized protein A4U43_C02F460, partial [Asparagus officinalis]